MPKKKLTKTQVKRKLKQASTIMYDLFLDKLGQLNLPHRVPKMA